MDGCSRRNLNVGIYNLHWRYQFILFLLYVLPQSQVIFRRIFHSIAGFFFIGNSLQNKQSCWLCFRVFNVKKWCSVSDSIAPQNLLLVLLHLLRVHRAIHHPLLYAHLLHRILANRDQLAKPAGSQPKCKPTHKTRVCGWLTLSEHEFHSPDTPTSPPQPTPLVSWRLRTHIFPNENYPTVNRSCCSWCDRITLDILDRGSGNSSFHAALF